MKLTDFPIEELEAGVKIRRESDRGGAFICWDNDEMAFFNEDGVPASLFLVELLATDWEYYDKSKEKREWGTLITPTLNIDTKMIVKAIIELRARVEEIEAKLTPSS